MPAWDIRQIALCETKGISVPKNARILDFGCGAGRRVYELIDAGYLHTEGYDVRDILALRNQTDRVRFHVEPDGHIPVVDASFDFVFSDNVLEHVSDQPAALREVVRVLKPGGVSVHVFPAKWQLIEPHIKVPLGGLRPFKRTAWYFLWAAVGVRAREHRGLAVRDLAHRNHHYAHAALNYWSCRQYQQFLGTLPVSWSWEEPAYMQMSYKPYVQRLARLAQQIPLFASLIRACWSRVLVFRKDVTTVEWHGSRTSPKAVSVE